MIALIDNYDGCVFNLFQLIGHFRRDIRIIRNDRMSVAELQALQPDHIVISGGGSLPEHTGMVRELVRTLNGQVPILGICLGYRALLSAYGASMSYLDEIMQGRASRITLATDSPLFQGLPQEIRGMRYHSLTVPEKEIPKEFRIIARASDGDVMGVQYDHNHTYGIQFHPESFLTQMGSRIMLNFLSLS